MRKLLFEGDWVEYLRATPISVGIQLNVEAAHAAHAAVLIEAVKMMVIASV
jgi:hypothetical protein